MNFPLDVTQFAISSQTIKTIPDNVFWLMIGILSLFLLYFLYKSYKNLIKTSVVQDTPTAKIRSAAQGYVELEGIQYRLKGEPTIAPLSKTPCTWYAYLLEHYQRKGWVTLEHGTSQGLFELRDETGRCVIDPKHAQVNTFLCESWFGFTRIPQPKPKTLIGRIFRSFGRYRYREWRMEEGMPLYALGNFHTVYIDKMNTPQDPTPFTTKDIKESLQIWNKQYTGLLATFMPKPAEKMTPEALSKLLGQANEEMQKKYGKLSNQTINVLSHEGLNSRMPLLLSSINQKKITFQSRLAAFLWFFGYVLILMIGGWLLVARF